MGTKKSENLLEGSIVTTLWKLALPIMIGNSMQVVYNLADTFWLGRIGADAVASLSVGFPIIFLLISIGGGITVAGTTLVSQYKGIGDSAQTNKVASQVLVFVMSLSIVLSIIGVKFNRQLLKLIGTPVEILATAEGYLNVIMSGVSFMFLFFIFSALLRGYGDTKTPMIMMVASTLLNIILDPFLIFGWTFFPRLEVLGAGLATVFSRAVAGLFGLFILLKGKKGIHIRLKYLKPDWTYIKKIIKIGVPSAGEMSIRALGMTAMMGIVTSYGSTVVAAYGIGMRILSMIMMPARGFSRATTTMVGQNLGAGNIKRAEKSVWISSGLVFVLLTTFGLIFALLANQIISIFNSDPAVISAGTNLLQILGISFGFLGIRTVIGGAFRGAGNTIIAMVLAGVSLFVLRIPIAKLLADCLGWQANGIWWGITIATILSALLSMIWFKRGSWKERVI
ncbi:MAG: MATE family efflux transporter [Bacillota bacterium]